MGAGVRVQAPGAVHRPPRHRLDRQISESKVPALPHLLVQEYLPLPRGGFGHSAEESTQIAGTVKRGIG